MLEVNVPVGNIFLDEGLNELKSGNFEKIKLSRMELEKRILRRKTDRGTDVGLKLDPGIKLRHGDVINNGNMKIIVEQLPEKVISIRLKTKDMVDVMVILGHTIGNRHRPISIQREVISFPIQADSEKEIFAKLFQGLIDHIVITIEEQIFLPHSGVDIHGH